MKIQRSPVIPFPKVKKQLGQHCLADTAVAKAIVEILQKSGSYQAVIEVGAGTGALTEWLIQEVQVPLYLVEVDTSLVAHLERVYGGPGVQIVAADFLKWWFPSNVAAPAVAVIGNFPYNISSQVFFKILTHRNSVQKVVCMVQHEVAQRIASPPGSKQYGILSVLLQAFYEISYCFSVPPSAFNPSPKVTSGVLELVRNTRQQLACDEAWFFRVVKTAFQQRRKMLKNALASLGRPLDHLPKSLLTQRAESLGVDDFITLTNGLLGV